MAKTGIIQLYNVDGGDLALFSFDPEVIEEHKATTIIEAALEDAFQKDEKGELTDNDVLSEAVDQLELKGITRIFAGIANTDRL